MKRPSLNYRFSGELYHVPSRTQEGPDSFVACRWRNLHGPDAFAVVGLQLDADCCYVVYNLAVGLTPLATGS